MNKPKISLVGARGAVVELSGEGEALRATSQSPLRQALRRCFRTTSTQWT